MKTRFCYPMCYVAPFLTFSKKPSLNNSTLNCHSSHYDFCKLNCSAIQVGNPFVSVLLFLVDVMVCPVMTILMQVHYRLGAFPPFTVTLQLTKGMRTIGDQ